jgi:hypothetical protein
MSQVKRVAQSTGKSKKVVRKGLKAYQKSRKTMLRSIDKKRSGGWAKKTEWESISYSYPNRYQAQKGKSSFLKKHPHLYVQIGSFGRAGNKKYVLEVKKQNYSSGYLKDF